MAGCTWSTGPSPHILTLSWAGSSLPSPSPVFQPPSAPSTSWVHQRAVHRAQSVGESTARGTKSWGCKGRAAFNCSYLQDALVPAGARARVWVAFLTWPKLFLAMSPGLAGQSFSPVLQKNSYWRDKADWPILVLSRNLLSPWAPGEAMLLDILAFVPSTLLQESWNDPACWILVVDQIIRTHFISCAALRIRG